jgi:hypothetical protein
MTFFYDGASWGNLRRGLGPYIKFIKCYPLNVRLARILCFCLRQKQTKKIPRLLATLLFAKEAKRSVACRVLKTLQARSQP